MYDEMGALIELSQIPQIPLNSKHADRTLLAYTANFSIGTSIFYLESNQALPYTTNPDTASMLNAPGRGLPVLIARGILLPASTTLARTASSMP